MLHESIDWTVTVLCRGQCLIVYIHFREQYTQTDVVSHTKLFTRLCCYGICGTLLCWLKNFFSGHTHCTRVIEDLVTDYVSHVETLSTHLYFNLVILGYLTVLLLSFFILCILVFNCFVLLCVCVCVCVFMSLWLLRCNK